MTKKELSAWSSLSKEQQIMRFKDIRKALGLTQTQLANELKLYGYSGNRSTIQAWECELTKIPVLVYELIFEGFAERKRSE